MQRLEVSGAVRPLYGSLGVKGLTYMLDRNAPLSHPPTFHHRKSICLKINIIATLLANTSLPFRLNCN